MIKVRILSVGKTKESWLEEALGEYVKRLQATIQVEFAFAKNDVQLVEWLTKESRAIALDPQGKLLTSEAFCAFFYE